MSGYSDGAQTLWISFHDISDNPRRLSYVFKRRELVLSGHCLQ